MTITQEPQPAAALLTHVAEALAREAGSKAFLEGGTAWQHARDGWLAHANTAINAVERWEAQGTLARLCVIPGCFRQLHLDRVEAGWMQSKAVGYMCPDHAPVLWAAGDGSHIPSWGYQDPEQPNRENYRLRCSCGWTAGPTRFRAHGTTLWQVHALETLETER
ncbi:hypothetical protein ACWGH4_26210 [Streptomyces sp. NPDC054847]